MRTIDATTADDSMHRAGDLCNYVVICTCAGMPLEIRSHAAKAICYVKTSGTGYDFTDKCSRPFTQLFA